MRKPRGNVEVKVNDAGQVSKMLLNEDGRCEWGRFLFNLLREWKT